MKSVFNFVKARDEIAPPGFSKLHFSGNVDQKTFVGGLLSFAVTLYTMYIAYYRGLQMLSYTGPKISSVIDKLEAQKIGKVPFTTLSKLYLEIQEGGDISVDLEAVDYLRYMHIRFDHIEKLFVDGEMVRTDTYYEYQLCQEDDYLGSDFSKGYYKNLVKGRKKQYCVKDPQQKIYFEGTRDSVVNEQDSAYGVIEVLKCTEATRLPGYPTCAPSEEIETFLSMKRVILKMINEKVDFNERGERAVRQIESYIPSVPIHSGVFSDTGYRLRYNTFLRTDEWFSGKNFNDPFYDYVFYNSDTYIVPDEYSIMAQMYFRLDSDQINHRRIVFSFMDFVGSMGGVSRILLQICGWIYGSYAGFYSSISTITFLYKLRQSPDSKKLFTSKFRLTDNDVQNIEEINWTLGTRICLWLQKSNFSKFYKVFRTKQHEKYLEIIGECSVRQKQEFDIVNIIKNQRESLHKIDLIKKKLNIDQDPIFETIDPRGICDLANQNEYMPRILSPRLPLKDQDSVVFDVNYLVDEIKSEKNKQIQEIQTANIIIEAQDLGDFQAFFPAGSKSELSKYLTEEIWDEYKNQSCAEGVSFKTCIFSGVQNLDSGIGVYAGSLDAYTKFNKLFDKIILNYHDHPPGAPHTSDMTSDGIQNAEFNPQDSAMITSTIIRVRRNLHGYPLGPGLTTQQRQEIMSMIEDACYTFEGDLQGNLFPLEGMSDQTQQSLFDNHFLLKEGQRFLAACNLTSDWPSGRAIFHNDAKTFLVWINEEDQLRLISMQPGASILEVFDRLCRATAHIETFCKFSHDPHLGYITSCPTNLGTGLSASIHIKLPKLAIHKDILNTIAERYDIQVIGVQGAVFEITNKRKLGLSEKMTVQKMIDGLRAIIETERKV